MEEKKRGRGRPPKSKAVEESDFLKAIRQLKIEKVHSLNSQSITEDDVIFVGITPPLSLQLRDEINNYKQNGYFGKATVLVVDNDIDLTLLKRSEIEE
jgi:hypothetical protein